MKKFHEMLYFERVVSVSGGNSKALKFLMNKIEDDNFNYNLELLYNYEIIGNRLNKLYDEACFGRDVYYDNTLKLFGLGVFTKKEILKNLDSEVITPFIDKPTFTVASPYLNEENIHAFGSLIKEIYIEQVGYSKVK
jgi:hypothetical protein